MRPCTTFTRKLRFADRLFFQSNTFSKYYSKYLGTWEPPDGHESGISIYNTLTHQNVPLLLKRKGVATWYMCGPTVYADSHIGHASCFVKFDIMRRIMENMFNINVVQLMGITDIDDKIIHKAKQTDIPFTQVSKKYELDFFKDMHIMRVKRPRITARVTECIPMIISFCQELIDKEYAYCTSEGNVYFIVSKGVSSDVLNEMPEDSLQVVDPLKKDQRDFALWKAAKPEEPYWPSPWGNGRPGWHIECSAMASNVFGCELDIHSGGHDLIFPHHTNEKSQSEAFHGCKQWVNYWIHSGLLQVEDDVKMSKSLGNTVSIKAFLKHNSVNDFRVLCLQSLYRNNISLSNETLSGAKSLHKKLHNFVNEMDSYANGEMQCPDIDESSLAELLHQTKENVKASLSNDFNTSQALFRITDLVDEVNKLLNTTVETENTFKNNPSIAAISSCAIFVDHILESLGVYIRCKKRLPNIYNYAIDAVVDLRRLIRKAALTKKNFSHENQSSVKIMENAFSTFDEKLIIIGIDIKTHIGVCEEVNSKMYSPVTELTIDIKKDLFNALEAVQIFEKQLKDFIGKLDLNNKNLSDDLDNVSPQERVSSTTQSKNSKKEDKLIPILNFCDSLRLTLEQNGIVVKDRGRHSTWYPTVEKSNS